MGRRALRADARLGGIFLIFGEGPSDMTTGSARLTLAAWGLAAFLAGGWRLLRSDANR